HPYAPTNSPSAQHQPLQSHHPVCTESLASLPPHLNPQPASTQHLPSLPMNSPTSPPSLSLNTVTLHYLDVGCGGSIFAESLARTIPPNPSTPAPTPTRTASIPAIDHSTTLIQTVRDHVRMDLTVDSRLHNGRFRYLNTTPEDVISYSSITNSLPATPVVWFGLHHRR
ncbi:hypothetical protein N7449_005785, partial [Penicillium cf. viridicatum]